MLIPIPAASALGARLVARHGALGMFLVTLGERLGLPVFLSPLLLAAGAIVALHPMQFAPILFATAVPCLLGDAMWYELGRWKGRSLIASLCRFSFVPDSLEQKAESCLANFRGVSMLWAKWIPGFAHLAPSVAGAAHLPRLRFHLFNAIGTLTWISLMLAAGVATMRTVRSVGVLSVGLLTHPGRLPLIAIAAGVLLVVGYGWWRRRQSGGEGISGDDLADELGAAAIAVAGE